VAIQRGINAAAQAGADAVTAMAQKCKGKGDLEKVATVSANHDVAIGRLIAEAIDKVGHDGVCEIEEGKTAETTLDEELSKELGFTPALLAMRVLRPENPAKPEGEIAPGEEDWGMYDELCSIGEALARAENPETYPSAQNDWKQANQYLNDNAGSGALELIKERAVERSLCPDLHLVNCFEEPGVAVGDDRVAVVL
jgi:hypothetical protein